MAQRLASFLVKAHGKPVDDRAMVLSLSSRTIACCACILACAGASLAAQALPELDETRRENRYTEFDDPADRGIDLEEPFAAPQDELEALRSRIAALEKAEQMRIDAEAKKKADEALRAEEWTDLSSEKWNVRLGGHVQLEYINWATAPPQIPAQDYFEFRRLRLLADGTGYGVYDFRLQMTLEPESVGESPIGNVVSPDVKDAYFSINEIPGVGRLRVGNFFVPFSLEQVTNDTNNIFLERSIPSQGVFSPDREVGVALYNCTEDHRFSWASGVFFDSISEGLKERINDNQGCRVSGRLNWLPYYDEPSGGRYLVHTGVGILHTVDQDGLVLFRSRPQIHEGPRLINSGAIAAENYTNANLEFAVVWGNVTVQSEAFLSQVNRTFASDEIIGGAYVHVSYFLTGENRIYERFGQHGAQFGRNAPFTNVFFTRGGSGLGAWEAKARWSNLNLQNLQAGEYNDLTVGFNWYWSDRVRIMFDWIHPITSGATPYGATEPNIIGTRFDFNW
jgi:phosphate-selective porin OprO/OprP